MRYVFGEYVLDTQLLELRRDGTLVQLERRVLNALMFLVQHRDRVVMRQELLEHLWPDRYVSNASLKQCIAAGRRAMGDSGRSQHIIQTLHGRGYRFIAVVDVQAPTHQEAVQEASARCPESDLKPEATHHDPLSPAYRVPEGEYKPVTILCGALAQPTALAKQLGLEALHDLTQAFFTQVEEVVHHYSGIVRPSGEDGFLAQFGIPIAQEDHAWRALLAADALQQRLRAFQAEMDDPQKTAFTVRLGIHTGRAAVGRGGEAQQVPTLVAGETTTIAMRLQYLAEPDMLLISETTLALVQDQVHSEAFELVRGTGPSESVMAYKVLAMHRQATAENPRWENGLSPFVGRQWELAGLHALLTRVQEGQGQVVGILGEPGIGKSRLLREFHQSIDETRSTLFNRTLPVLWRGDPLRRSDRSPVALLRHDAG